MRTKIIVEANSIQCANIFGQIDFSRHNLKGISNTTLFNKKIIH